MSESDATISSIDIYDKSLYEAEEYANKFETELIQAITGLPNIRWWHRNIARTDFAINGFINHYPDFIVRTRSGKIVIIDTKGDHLANEETLAKLHLGRAWQERFWQNYNQRTKHHFAPHDPHPADQGLHFEQILPLQPVFCAIGNKNAGNAQQNAIHA